MSISLLTRETTKRPVFSSNVRISSPSLISSIRVSSKYSSSSHSPLPFLRRLLRRRLSLVSPVTHWVEEPITNAGPAMPLGLTERSPHGLVVPMPTLPLCKMTIFVSFANDTKMVILQSGNVGIGTTSPWGLLSVNPNGIAGPAFVIGSSTQCVTGDTKLKRRRKRRRKNGKGEWEEEEYFEDTRIDEIKEGDEILTLDEKTGKLKVSRVRKLMQMGRKPIIELETALGRKIRTTSNHPYLVKTPASLLALVFGDYGRQSHQNNGQSNDSPDKI